MSSISSRGIRRSLATILFFTAIASSSAARAEEPPEETHDDGPHRQGFTLELGLGPAYTRAFNDTGTRYGQGDVGLSGLSLSLGSYVSPTLAVVLRAAGTSFWHDQGHGTQQVVNGVYGASVIGWMGDFYVSGGAGVAILGAPNDTASPSPLAGFGLDLRAGYAFYDSKHHAFTIGLEATPAFYDAATVVGTGVNLEWHYF